jgi:hypothetical protein
VLYHLSLSTSPPVLQSFLRGIQLHTQNLLLWLILVPKLAEEVWIYLMRRRPSFRLSNWVLSACSNSESVFKDREPAFLCVSDI